MFSIDNQAIDLAENILFSHGEAFDQQRRDVIKCMESKDIQACPGSGKTTTLLAKLYIISRQLPTKSNQGICVLTHTNVAAAEIRERLQGKADVLFQYPNYFGTIQSFVNNFLAIPAYIDTFGKKPARIDDEFYWEYINRKSRSLPFTLKTWLERSHTEVGYLRFNMHNFRISKKLEDADPVISSPSSSVYPLLEQFKYDILREGVLSYDDAYALAFSYLRKYPMLKEVFSERFAYIFVDEMQDTDFKQNRLLEVLFDLTKVIVQKIGDRNQSIFNSPTETVWNVSSDSLSISDSKRFSVAIADVVKHVCLEPQDLKGNPNIANIAPTIIVFDDDTILNVLPAFGDLIFEHRLNEAERKIFKTFGWVGQVKSQRTTPSYFPSYGLQDKFRQLDFECLKDYFKIGFEEDSINSIRKSIYRAMLKCLRIAGVKQPNQVPYTETKLNEFIKNNHFELHESLKNKMVQWCMQYHQNIDIVAEVRTFIRTELCPVLGGATNTLLTAFLDAPSEHQPSEGSAKSNVYQHTKGDYTIPIQVSTVHSVKGETHTASLYLETFYYNYDIESLMEYLKGIHTTPTQVRVKERLNIAYVGMTRASHLLCIAAHKKGCMQHLKELEAVGWKIHILK